MYCLNSHTWETFVILRLKAEGSSEALLGTHMARFLADGHAQNDSASAFDKQLLRTVQFFLPAKNAVGIVKTIN